ncbi:MAG: pilus assembly protein [Planctomycetes bacterium]|nr:pilus assembly protein [Planctomycetota bacterium]
MKRGKGSQQRFRGTTLAEAAIVMMVLCLVTLGALQYGWFFYCLHSATNAARQGARVASVLDGTLAEGTTALQAALAGLPAATTSAVTEDTANHAVRGEVVIPAANVALMPISFLPVPDCVARVTMAKEGAG